jgi:tetratricopeptide (TPR) repeat protein
MLGTKKVAFLILVKWAIFILTTLAFAMASYERNIIWQDRVTLCKDTLEKSPNKARPNYELWLAAAGNDPQRVTVYEGVNLADALYLNFMAKSKQMDTGFFNSELSKNESLGKIEAYINLGKMYESKGFEDIALECFEFALKLKPGDARIHNAIAIIYGRKGLIDKALEHLQVAVIHEPDFAEAYNNLGNAYRVKGSPNLAVAQYRHALKLSPNYADAHYNLGLCFLGEGLTAKARKEFERSLQVDPGYEGARQMLKNISN